MNPHDCKFYMEWVEHGETFRDCLLGDMTEDGRCLNCLQYKSKEKRSMKMFKIPRFSRVQIEAMGRAIYKQAVNDDVENGEAREIVNKIFKMLEIEATVESTDGIMFKYEE